MQIALRSPPEHPVLDNALKSSHVPVETPEFFPAHLLVQEHARYLGHYLTNHELKGGDVMVVNR